SSHMADRSLAACSTERLSGVCETLLIPLAARVVESQRETPAFLDRRGVEFAQRLDFDPEYVARDRWNAVGCQARTVILDAAVQEFLTRNPRSLVINLGAGLCTRYWRMNASRSLHWYDIDLPSVIQLKRELLAVVDSEPAGSNREYSIFDADVTDHSWMNQVERTAGDRVLIITEGLLMYLEPDAVRQLLVALADRFPGAELLMEAWSPFVRRVWGTLSPALRRTGASLHWGLDRPQTIERWDSRIRLKQEWRPGDWEPRRWGLLRFMPRLRRSLTKVVHFEFAPVKGNSTAQEFAA
ncbi:MAG: class I SAM-dependent methyltransferase, partial [Planctomycetaceae bacterium]|nr:class I SAM-dependent methyltransferase [Planctomycetaceae bacterium]